jgi:dipeptidyl aminopeptidase/acylaminoacyl peptidase
MKRLALTLLVLAGLGVTAPAGPAQIHRSSVLNGRIAYSLFDLEEIDGFASLFVRDPVGIRKRAVLRPGEGSAVYTEPDWSPSGTELAVTYTVGNRYSGYTSDIYLCNQNGGQLRRLIDTPGDRRSPAWSPDGSEIAYAQSPRDIYIAGADGSHARRLTDGFDPAWSPDGDKIVFARGAPGDDASLYEIGVDGSNSVALTGGPVSDGAPDWSPDGRRIVFQRGTAFISVYSIGSDGSGLRRLTKGSRPFDTGPSWSPDGTRIVFAHGGDLWTMRPDGSGRRDLTNTKGLSRTEDAPDWQPVHVVDGKITGTRFDDYLAGGPGNDVFVGGLGRDRMIGAGGNDLFYARDGRQDRIDGGAGRDRAFVDRSDRVRRVELVVR